MSKIWLSVGLCASLGVLALAGCKKTEAPKAEAVTQTAVTEMPKRKPGMWEQLNAFEDGSTMTSRFCIDADTDTKLPIQGAQGAGSACVQQSLTKGSDGDYNFASTCNMGTGGSVKISGKATGDFNTAYNVSVATETSGAAVPQMNRAAKAKIAVRWAGVCPMGWLPGDIELPGGTRINNIGVTGAVAP